MHCDYNSLDTTYISLNTQFEQSVNLGSCLMRMRLYVFVTGLVKSSFHAQMQIFKNANFNYFKYCILAKDTDTCM